MAWTRARERHGQPGLGMAMPLDEELACRLRMGLAFQPALGMGQVR